MTTTSLPREQTTAYRHSVDKVIAALDTDAERGLSQREARVRVDRYGRNQLTAEKPIPAWRKLLAQFRDVLVGLLLIATAISAGLWLYERESVLPYEAMAIFAVVLLNAVMGYVQQSRAEQAVAALRQMAAAEAHVIREDARQTVPATDLVPGDVILVGEGDTIPADARLIESTVLQTAEAALTVETWLQRALDVARRQEVRSLELRAAMSLSSLWHQQGKRKEAHHLLAEVYAWFTEGFDTVDLQEAKALIEELA